MLPRWSSLKLAHSIVDFAALFAILACVNFLSTSALGFSKRTERKGRYQNNRREKPWKVLTDRGQMSEFRR